MDSSRSDMENDPTAIFPRIDIRDPYKRLGISREASEEEIQAARNFLMQKYAVHKPNVKAIESAYDKITMQNFYERKNPKFSIKKKVRHVSQARVVQALIMSIYFIYNRLKSKMRAFLRGRRVYSFVATRNLLDGVCDSPYT